MIDPKWKYIIPKYVNRTVVYALLIILSLFVIFPLLWIISTSFKPANEVMSIPPRWIPDHPTLENYINVLTNSSIPRHFLNSVLVSSIVAVVSVLAGGVTGYGLARRKSRGTSGISMFILGSQMLPATVVMVPLYLFISRFELYDTVFGLALAHLTLTMPLVTWLCKGYIDTIPIDLEEAAQMEGCSRLQALRLVILPIAAPGVAAAGMYAFVQSWNEFTLASVLTASDKSRTLPIGLTEFASLFKIDWGSTMAASVIISIPVIIIFFFMQKYIVGGLAQGAVKG
ncbi:MAG: carbohydrate ABC transporter permease [Chloroflexi bacterium]|nr:carbohydrate ABC transporter permease [Anaerolineaceae bacterium]NMB88989.1 carbohydrate ABC transporter permease [Chloroflexota bacterium]